MAEPNGTSDVTQLLREWRGGNNGALERLLPLVYDELHVIAARHMAREWRVSVYQTTALVSEAYRLLRPGGLFVLTCYGRNLLHRLRGERERFSGGLYFRRHSPRDVRELIATRFDSTFAGACVGLPDFLPFPWLDRLLSRLPGWGLVGRIVVCSARKLP